MSEHLEIPIFKTFVYNNKCYLYDTYSNQLLMISKKHCNELQLLEKIGKQKYKLLENTEKEHHDIVLLMEKGMLKGNYIKNILHPQTKYINDLLHRCVSDITLQVTRDCNFKCQYCLFAAHSQIERCHEKINMSYLIAKQSVDFLYNHSKDSMTVNVAFYGGEPLLNFDLISEVVNYADNLFISKKVNYIMTTNGSLLSDAIIDFLAKHNFNLTISLDGPQEVQNKHRKFLHSGEGTFQAVYNNVLRLKKIHAEYFNNFVNFSPVFFSDEDYNNVELFYESIGIDKKKILANSASLSGIDYIEQGILKFDSNKKSLNNDLNHVFNDKSYISEIWHHDGPCVPGMKKLFIDVNGDFYTCEKFVEDKKSSIGNLSHGFDLKKIEEYLNIGVLTENECKSCWASRFCNICALSCVNTETGELDSNLKFKMCISQKKKALAFFKKYINDINTGN